MRSAWFSVAFLMACGASAHQKPCSAPVWTVDLAAKYHLRFFGEVKHPRNAPPLPWMASQGVLFMAPDVLAIYQVLESNESSPPEPRDASGGGGRYVLQIVFLNSATGNEVHTLRLTTTSSDVSGVYPTHDGGFLVETGQLLRLYSPTFQEVASRSLPTSPYGKRESWRVSVIPPGRRIYIAAAEHYLLDSDTLETIWHPNPSDVAFWAEGRRFFPELKGSDAGVFNPEGQQVPLDLSSNSRSRVLWTFLDVPHHDSGGWDPKELRVFASSGQVVWVVKVHDKFDSFSSNGSLLAAAIYRHRANPFDLDLAPKPIRIGIYDLPEKLERCSIRITIPVSGWWDTRFYDLSSAGTVAVLQGNLLSLYQP
jgi:hypothetical protein